MLIISHETGGVAIEEIVGLKPKINLFLEAKAVNTTSHNEYNDVLLNNILGIWWIESDEKIIEQETLKSTIFYHALMINYIS